MSILTALKTEQLAQRKLYMKTKQTEFQIRAKLLTTLLGDLETDSKTSGDETTDVDVTCKLKKYINNAHENISFQMDGSSEAEELLLEKQYLETFLPQQMSEDQIRSTLQAHIDTDVTYSMGQLMGYMNENHAGLYDGRTASKIAREMMSPNKE